MLTLPLVWRILLIGACIINQVGGPTWPVKLGRRDSTTASKELAESNLPKPTDDLDALIASFARQGLSMEDMVALSGFNSHTLNLYSSYCTLFANMKTTRRSSYYRPGAMLYLSREIVH